VSTPILNLSLNQSIHVNQIQAHHTPNRYQKHTPSSFSYYIKCFDDDVYKHDPVSGEAGDDVAGKFVETLEEQIKHYISSSSFLKV